MDNITLGQISVLLAGMVGLISAVEFLYLRLKKTLNSVVVETVKKELEGVIKEMTLVKESELIDMRNDLSNKFFVYSNLAEVEDYLVISFQEKCELYFELGGDSYIHPMYDASKRWKIKQSGYCK